MKEGLEKDFKEMKEGLEKNILNLENKNKEVNKDNK